MPADSSQEIRIGISSCLLGEKVRFDGGHKRDHFLTDTVSGFVEFVPVCPEMEVGLGAPRETIRLERAGRGTRLVAPRSGKDHTAAMRRFSRRRAAGLAGQDLCGFILKKDSPSCGLERVRVYGRSGVAARNGRGLFAEALVEVLPHLPVEEEGRLRDPRLRENFFERVFAFRRLRALFQGRWGLGGLVRFHAGEKMLLLAHDPERYRRLGRLVARAKSVPRQQLRSRYSDGFMEAMASPATVRRHVNVLQHMAGFFKERISQEERQELHDLIQDYRRRLVPLIVPVTLIRHLVRVHGERYLEGQSYLEPHPKELVLRNHV